MSICCPELSELTIGAELELILTSCRPSPHPRRFIISAVTTKTGPRYASLFLMLGGLFGSYNIALAWISSSFPRPRAKRASAYAIINSLGWVSLR